MPHAANYQQLPLNNYEGPGLYRHYKGGEYEVLGLSIDESTLSSVEVVYRPVDHSDLGKIAGWESDSVELWRRPLDDFNELVMLNHNLAVRRFEKIK